MDSSAFDPEIIDDTTADIIEDVENDEETQRLIAESHLRTLPVNIVWMISTSCGIIAILWAMFAALSNRKVIGAKEIPYIAFLFANLIVLVVIEIPDIVIFTTGEPVHNEWSKFIYETVNNIPLFNLAWIGLQNWLQVAHPEWLSANKSLAIGAMTWFFSIALALPLSISFSLIDEDEEYMTKYVPLFITSFLLQKGLPLAFAVISNLLASLSITTRLEQYSEFRQRSFCWPCGEKTTRSYITDFAATILFTFVWISEDVHILIYLINGANLSGLELYHIAIYNLIETTAIFASVLLVMSGIENLRRIRCCRESAVEAVESNEKSMTASVANLLSNPTEDDAELTGP